MILVDENQKTGSIARLMLFLLKVASRKII